MSDERSDPQNSEPPTNTGGGNTSVEAEELQTAESQKGDPPTNTGGGENT